MSKSLVDISVSTVLVKCQLPKIIFGAKIMLVSLVDNPNNCQGPATRATPTHSQAVVRVVIVFPPFFFASTLRHLSSIPSDARVTQELKKLGLYTAKQFSFLVASM